jgi:hypothetical protein
VSLNHPTPYYHQIFICDCGSVDHQIVFSDWNHDPDSLDKELYVRVLFPEWRPWYRRLLTAIKYIFRPHSQLELNEIIMSVPDQRVLRDFLTERLKNQ